MEIIRQHTDCRKNEQTGKMTIDTIFLLHIFGHYIVATIRKEDDGKRDIDYRPALDVTKISKAITKYNALVESVENR